MTRTLLILSLASAVMIVVPASAQIGISSVGNADGFGFGRNTGNLRRPDNSWWGQAERYRDRVAYGVDASSSWDRRGVDLSGQVSHLRGQIDDARDAGQLSRRDARRFDRQARGIESRLASYAGGGFSESEASELQFRISALQSLLLAPRPAPRGR